MIIDRVAIRSNDPYPRFCGRCGKPWRICHGACQLRQIHAEAGLLYSTLCILRSVRTYDKRLSLLCERARLRWHRRLIAWQRAT